MTVCAFLKNRRKAEYPTFEKVLRALPVEHWNYRPHEKSASAGEIVWMLARESQACSELIDNGIVNWLPQLTPTEPEQILSAFREQYVSLDDRIDRIGDAAWQKRTRLLVDGQLYREAPLGEFLWYFFFDAIHHRGQLSTYIRPMGGKVPSIYGPSGDDPGDVKASQSAEP